jgi:DNA-binding beta-propeller fold protein YncE
MKSTAARILGSLAVAFLLPGAVLAGRAASQYYFLQEIPIGGAAGSPSLSIDPESRRLYVTHSTKIEVVDLDSDQAAGTISNTPSVRGFAVAPSLHRGFSSNSRDGALSVIDLNSRKTTAKLATGPGAGPMLFVPGQDEIYAFNTRTPSATVFDAASGKLVAKTRLPGKPQIAAADPGLERVYCNLFDKNEVVALDAKTHKIAGTWPVAPGKEPSGIAVDLSAHRVFVGCRNKILVMLDGLTGKLMASAPIGTGVDSTAFDPSSGLVFCANSDGTATIAHEDAPDKLSVVQTLTTERNARIMALDPKTHKIYLATTDFEAQTEPDPGTPQTRPRTLANTLKILVYAPGPAQP